MGNAPDSGCLEILLGGFSCVCHGQALVAVTGAPAPLEVLTRAGRRLQPAPYQPFLLEDGDRLSLGSPPTGLRSYLALRGGFAVAPVLGSLARDTLGQCRPGAPGRWRPPGLLSHGRRRCRVLQRSRTPGAAQRRPGGGARRGPRSA
ncbi:allophanate hydrolase subunit 2 [Pseudomonas psychrotolerans]|nr:allophanate hydrolase subunit 2 [Pseudomonas psychrotolerans]